MTVAEKVEGCGVVGAGGAGFPTHLKLGSGALGSGVDAVIVNGAECEPLLGSDVHVMETEGGKIVEGLAIMLDALGARSGLVAVKRKHARAIGALAEAAQGRREIEVRPIDDFYPAGDEFVLVYEVTGRRVPEGGIPPAVGCMVNNVETVLNIREAVLEGRPVTRRYLTCTGEVNRPSIVRAHVGTSIREIVALCGGASCDDPAYVVGGPLMGSLTTDADLPVTKTTSGIVVLPPDHPLVTRKTVPLSTMLKLSKAACCQCTYCTELCPRALLGYGIEPHRIMRQTGFGFDEAGAAAAGALLCSGCGLCEAYACVMGISPCAVSRAVKNRLAARGGKPGLRPPPERTNGERNAEGAAAIGREPADSALLRPPNPLAAFRRVPSGRVIERLGLGPYARRGLHGAGTGSAAETEPWRVEIPMKQHIGEPAVPVVREGDRVKEGDLIGRIPEGKTGARVHASIGGTVLLADGERVIIERAG